MADHERQTRPAADAHPPAGAAANDQVDNRPATGEPQLLPPWKVLLHNDNVNSQPDVVETIVMLTGLSWTDAVGRMLEAHFKGVSLLLTTHRERAELHVVQFMRRNLTVTIEPA